MEIDLEAIRKRIYALLQQVALSGNVSREVLDETKADVSAVFEALNITLKDLQASNETLAQTRHQLEKEHQRFHELFYFAPDSYLETDINGMILQANEAASDLFNQPVNTLGQIPLRDFIVPEDQRKFDQLFRPPQRISDLEMKLQPGGSQPITASISLMPVKNKEGQPVAVWWLVRDVTAQKIEQVALSASEERFRTIFTHAHFGMALTDLAGRIVESNLAFERMVGYVREELQGLVMEGLVHPKDREEIDQVCSDLLDQPESGRTIEGRFLTKNEQEIWVRQTISALPDMQGEPVYFVYLVENITQEKQSDEELAEMKRRMIDSIESERLHLAQELHDGPIQDLYGAAIKLTELPGNGGPEHDNIKETQDLIKQVAGTLRVICGDLRPPTLSNFGLDRAIQTHVEQIQEQNKGMQIKLETDRDDRLLSQDVRLGLFRIYQQCMANTIRHSKATEVVVRLEIDEEDVVLTVEDNGVGFEPPTRMVELLRTGHYGLAGIAERVESLRGSLMIDSSPGNGTRVTVEVPRQEVPSERS